MTAPDPPILPTLADVIGTAKDRLGEVRPTAFAHVERGNYASVLHGWRGQFGLARARLLAETDAARLSDSTGDELTDLARSNYDTPRTQEPAKAIGEVVLTRAIVHYAVPATDPTITTSDARDEATLLALYAAIIVSTTAHAASVFDSTTGVGSHITSSSPYNSALTFPITVQSYADGVNAIKAWIEEHFGDTTLHLDADANVVTVSDAEPISGGVTWSNGVAQDKAQILALINAEKRILNAHYARRSSAGTIRKDFAFRLSADPAAVPPVEGGQYIVAQDTPVAISAQSATVPFVALLDGPAANLPIWAAGAGPERSVAPQGTLFDTSFSVTAIRAAGGSTGQPDAVLREAARATWTGRYGPTRRALVAGVLRSVGAADVVIREDPLTGTAYAYPVDERWAQSDRWNATVLDALNTSWRGLGCKVQIGAVQNHVVRVELVVVLRDAGYLADTSGLTAALQKAVLDYFETRPDWWRWRLGGIRSAAASADRIKIKSVSLAVVRDEDGVQISEPTDPDPGDTLTHWWFADNALSVSFNGPS